MSSHKNPLPPFCRPQPGFAPAPLYGLRARGYLDDRWIRRIEQRVGAKDFILTRRLRADGRLVSLAWDTAGDGTAEQVLTLEDDAAGRCSAARYESPGYIIVIAYEYDIKGLVAAESETLEISGIVTKARATFEYDDAGHATRIDNTSASGRRTREIRSGEILARDTQYDAEGRLVFDLEAQFDDAGRVVVITATSWGDPAGDGTWVVSGRTIDTNRYAGDSLRLVASTSIVESADPVLREVERDTRSYDPDDGALLRVERHWIDLASGAEYDAEEVYTKDPSTGGERITRRVHNLATSEVTLSSERSVPEEQGQTVYTYFDTDGDGVEDEVLLTRHDAEGRPLERRLSSPGAAQFSERTTWTYDGEDLLRVETFAAGSDTPLAVITFEVPRGDPGCAWMP